MIIQKNKVIYPELSYKINGILFKVRKNLGQYRNEKQYCDAIEEELKHQNLIFEREKVLDPSFPGEVKGRNKVDFLIENQIILEVKAKPFVSYTEIRIVKRSLKSV